MPSLPRICLILLALSLPHLAAAGTSAPVPPPQIHQSVDRGIKYLQTESGAWLSKGRCAACHHAAMPLWALSEADRAGYSIDRKFLADSIESALGSQEKMIASGLVANPTAPPDPRPLAKGVSMGQIFMAVAAESFPSISPAQQQSVAWITTEALKKQREDGSWDFYLSRPPINENQATDAAWIIMALQGEKDATVAQIQKAGLRKAESWLALRDPANNPQVERLQLLIALRSHQPKEKLRPALDRLLSLQLADGGWAQLPESKSDAFATGQSLYVLSQADYTIDDPRVHRAIEFLVTTQLPDGSWPMTSRATPDGRPGSAKLLTPITCGAASWATMALARLAPKPAQN